MEFFRSNEVLENEKLKNLLSDINDIINNTITKEDKFIDKNVYLSYRKCVNEVTIVFQKAIEKNNIINFDLNLERGQLVGIKKNTDLSNSFCKDIKKSFFKILYILKLIKHIYNVENKNEFNLYNILFNQIYHKKNNRFKITYCKSKQLQDNKNLNLNNLAGYKIFTEEFLNIKERNIFEEILQYILINDEDKTICNFSNDVSKVFFNILNEKNECNNINTFENINVLKDKKDIMIDAFNPVFSLEACSERAYIYIDNAEITDLYKIMRENYKENILQVKKILNNIVEINNGKYQLKDINKANIDKSYTEIKKQVMKFYIVSLLDYNKIIKRALKLTAEK